MKAETVVVLGASPNPERFAYRAVKALKAAGHRVLPVHPKGEPVQGLSTLRSLGEVAAPPDTLTLYVGPEHVAPLIPSILALKPGRVILNPGTESGELMRALDGAGIPYQRDCTLILLSTGKF